jgi:hypothetical protein
VFPNQKEFSTKHFGTLSGYSRGIDYLDKLLFKLEFILDCPADTVWFAVPIELESNAPWLTTNSSKKMLLVEILNLGVCCDKLKTNLEGLYQIIQPIRGILDQPPANEAGAAYMRDLKEKMTILSSFFDKSGDKLVNPNKYGDLIWNWIDHFNPCLDLDHAKISDKTHEATVVADVAIETSKIIPLLQRADEVNRKTGHVVNHNHAGNSIITQNGRDLVATDNTDRSLEINNNSKNWNWSAIFIHASLGIILLGILTQRTENSSKGGGFGNIVSGVLSKVPVIGKFLDWMYTVISATK